MSSFKQLSKADVTSVSYAANKQWNLSFFCYPTSNEYITIYKGTNFTGSFSPTEPTSNGQYERLIYDSINHIFYQEYTSSLDTGSIMFNVNTYESASQQRPTSSYFDYNTNPLLIKNFPTGNYQGDCEEYTLTYVAGGGDVYFDYLDCNGAIVSIGPVTGGSQTFCATKNSVQVASGNYTLTDNGACVASSSLSSIRVLVINQDIYGSKVLPNSFVLSSSAYSVTDDGYGNLYDSGSIHIGNIFYAFGIGVITNQDYQLMFPTSSTACGTTTTTTSTTTTTTTIPTTTTTTSTTTSTTTAPTTTTTTTSTTTTTTTEPTTTTTTSTTTTTTTEPTTTTSTTTSTTTEPTTTTTSTTTTTTTEETYTYYNATQYLNCVQNSSPGAFVLRVPSSVGGGSWWCGDDGYQYQFDSNISPDPPSFDVTATSAAGSCGSLPC
jgi:hypothetical protein